MHDPSARLNSLMRIYRDPVDLSRAISQEYLSSSEDDRTDLAMAMAWTIVAQIARENAAKGVLA